MKLFMKKESNMAVSPVVYQLLAWLLILTTLVNDTIHPGKRMEEILTILAILNNVGSEVKLLLELLKMEHILCRIRIVEDDLLKDILLVSPITCIYVLVIGTKMVMV